MKEIKKLIYKICNISHRGLCKIFISPGIKASMGKCGRNVKISYDFDVRGIENIFIGDDSQIGPHSLFWSTRAKIVIGNKVLMGPGVRIITGDHRIDVIGKHISDVSDEEKLEIQDMDVVIEDGVWIGVNVTILKGVTIGEGAIIAAGSVVTKNVDAYSVWAGVPAKKIKERFSQEELKEHKRLLAEKETHYD